MIKMNEQRPTCSFGVPEERIAHSYECEFCRKKHKCSQYIMSKQVRENDVPCMSEELEMEEEFCDICGERCGGEGYRGPGEILCNKCACEEYDQPAPPEEEAKELAHQHWNYVEKVIVTADPEIGSDELNMIKFHYITAFEHGHKHGREYAIDHSVAF